MFVNENVFPILTFLKQTFQGLLQKLKFSFIILTFFFYGSHIVQFNFNFTPIFKSTLSSG